MTHFIGYPTPTYSHCDMKSDMKLIGVTEKPNAGLIPMHGRLYGRVLYMSDTD